MTREEAKELLPIIQAFAEGKTIQSKQINASDKGWRDIEECNFLKGLSYRIKPEPKYRPFKTQEECWSEMHKHPDFGWVKSIHYGDFLCINSFSNQGNIFRVSISNMSLVMEYAFNNYTFTDGEPFGIKEE